MEHIKKYWYWYALLVIAIIVLAMNWKKWFGKKNGAAGTNGGATRSGYIEVTENPLKCITYCSSDGGTKWSCCRRVSDK